MNYHVGDIVRSTQGRDKDQLYIIWETKGNMLLLVNGKSRKLSKPKLKKVIHVAFVQTSETLTKALQNGKVNDAYLRKILSNVKGV
jgi:ribosomal protein L14E/L6E/L27E